MLSAILLAAAVTTFKLAVVPVEFADVAHDARFETKDIETMLFSKDVYRKSPTGEACFGSVADYYRENSSGRFELTGRVFDWTRISSPRKKFEKTDTLGKVVGFPLFLTRALHALEAREGEHALDGYDAVSFVYAGQYGPHLSALWPHSAGLPWHGRLLRYYVMSEKEGERFSAIGVHCHEFGHVLGILDKYGEGKHAGLGIWCLMAIGGRGDAQNGERRPLHLCAWCKQELGWLDARTVDPRKHETIRLHGIEGHPAEAVKVLIDPSGSEYFLLENRTRTGFDAGTPGAGLLIWHVGELGQRLRNGVAAYSIDLEEAHGDETRAGPFHDYARIPWPQPNQTAFTPTSHPDSTSWDPFALAVSLVDIHRENDDIVFTVAGKEAPQVTTPAVGAVR